MSLISGRRRTATARAVGATRMIEIPRKAILKLLAAAPRAKGLVDQAFLLRAFGGYLFPGVPRRCSASSSIAPSSRTRQGRGRVQAGRQSRHVLPDPQRHGEDLQEVGRQGGRALVPRRRQLLRRGGALLRRARTATVTTIFPRI
jgi:hypothetical protein